MPETMSIERRKLLLAYGAKLVLTEGPKGMNGAIAQGRGDRGLRSGALRAAAAVPNPANPAIHETTTGPEIWEDTDGNVDIFVCGRGHGRHDHRRVALLQAQAREGAFVRSPSSPPRARCITQKLAGEPLKPSPHKIQGIGAGFIPDTLDLSRGRRGRAGEQRGGRRVRAPARARGRHPRGISCGAAAAVAVRLAKQPGTPARRSSWSARFRRALPLVGAVRGRLRRGRDARLTPASRRRGQVEAAGRARRATRRASPSGT